MQRVAVYDAAMLTETEFHARADAVLADLEAAVDAGGADMDCETVGDVMTLEFANGSKIIVNKQTPLRQIWVAAKSGGFHYKFDPAGDRWVNDQTGVELFQDLSRLASQQAGAPVNLR